MVPLSYFDDCRKTAPSEEVTLENLIGDIKRGKYKKEIEDLRSAPEDEAPGLKKKLPCVTLSGTFSKRGANNLNKHSGLIQIDIDGKDNPIDIELDPESFRDTLNKNDPYCVAAFVSPSGNGVKAVLKIDPDRHGESFHAAEAYFTKQYKVKIDSACKGISHLCFVSYDPEAWHDPEKDILPIPNERHKAQEGTRDPLEGLNPTVPGVCLAEAEKTLQGIDPDINRADWLKVACGLKHQFHNQPEDAWDLFHAWSKKGDKYESEADCRKLWDSVDPHNKRGGNDITWRFVQGLVQTSSLLRTHEDRIAEYSQPREWLVEDMILASSVNAVIALPGQGKTLFAAHLAEQVASGQPVGMNATRRGEVIYLCNDSPEDTERRFTGVDEETGKAIYTAPEFPPFPQGASEIKKLLDEMPKVTLVIIDTWDATRHHTDSGYAGQDQALEEIFRHLRHIAWKRKIAIVVVHHSTKNDNKQARGSLVFNARMDSILNVESKGTHLKVEASKMRAGSIKSFGEWTIEVRSTVKGEQEPYLSFTGLTVLSEAEERETKLLRAMISEEKSHKDLAEETGIPKGSIGRRIKALQKNGMVSDGVTSERGKRWLQEHTWSTDSEMLVESVG